MSQTPERQDSPLYEKLIGYVLAVGFISTIAHGFAIDNAEKYIRNITKVTDNGLSIGFRDASTIEISEKMQHGNELVKAIPVKNGLTSHSMIKFSDKYPSLESEQLLERACASAKTAVSFPSDMQVHWARALLNFTGSGYIRDAVEESRVYNLQALNTHCDGAVISEASL